MCFVNSTKTLVVALQLYRFNARILIKAHCTSRTLVLLSLFSALIMYIVMLLLLLYIINLVSFCWFLDIFYHTILLCTLGKVTIDEEQPLSPAFFQSHLKACGVF